MAEITGVLLAAGFGTRFDHGSTCNKLLCDINGKPIIAHSAAALSPCDRILAVVRDDTRLLAVLESLGIETLVNPEPERGMGYSIACAVRSTRQDRGWCLLPADMPFVRSTTTAQLLKALRAGALLAAPQHRARRGHPVAFSAHFAEQLCELDGDTGARGIVGRNADVLELISTDDAGVLLDVDNRETVDKLTAHVHARST
jgi:molybdenum cofactor cytidylyltransferase